LLQYLFKRLTVLLLLSLAVFAQEVTMSNTVGLTLNSNFGGWSGDYFAEMYIPAANGLANSIDFNISDLPDVTGGSLSVAIYAANYPWDEINTESIADAAPDSWLGYYDNDGIFDISGDNWVFGGINNVDGADSSYQYDPLGDQLWPESGMVDMPVYPNADDEDTLTFDLENSESGPFYFVRTEAFIVVVKLTGFEDQSDNTEYRMGFRSGTFHHDPQPCLKFYNTISSPDGRTGINDWGWYIRSFVWDWSVNAALTSCCHVRFQVDQLRTTLSTDDRVVNATILSDDPSGNVSVVEARLHYTVNDETFVVSMVGDDDQYTGVLPGQEPGTEVLYWVSVEFSTGDIYESEASSYSIFEAVEPMLFVYDADDLGVGVAKYYYNVTLADTFYNNFDTWDPKFGPVTIQLINNYELVYHVMGSGPYNDPTTYSTIYADWLSQGTVEAPRRLFITGQDYGIISGFADTTFPAGAFENMYLGVETLGPQDIGYDPWGSIADPYAVDAVAGDPLTGHLAAFEGDSLQLYHDPFGELGFGNWIDNLTPSSGTVCFTDPGMSDAAVAVYNEGPGWKTAFWTIDPLALSFYSPIDISSMYHWGLNVNGGPVAATFDWFGPPNYSTVGLDDVEVAVPTASKLYANYPNPFNPVTSIAYELGNAADVNITVYNMLGQEVATLVAGFQTAGAYTVQWSGIDAAGHSVSSGLYFYTMQTEGFSATQKMMLLK